MTGLRRLALVAVGLLLPVEATAEPCGQTPKPGGDPVELARATTEGDAAHRLEALRALAALLAVNRTVPVSPRLDGDWVRPQIVPQVTLTPPVIEALAERLVDEDAAVRACAAEAVRADLFSFQAPVRPPITWISRPTQGLPLVRAVEQAPGPARKAMVQLLMATGGSHDYAVAIWEKMVAGASATTIVLIAQEVFALLPTDREFEHRWNDDARAALNGLFRAAARGGHLDALFELAELPRKRTPDRGWLALDLREGLELAVSGGRLGPAGERKLLAHLRKAGSRHDLALMGELQDPEVQREAAAHLIGVLEGGERWSADAAASALVRLSDPEVQAKAIAVFAGLLKSDDPEVLHAVARALPELTDPDVPEKLANILLLAMRRCTDARAARALFVAFGRIAWGEQTVQILTEFYRNSPSYARGVVVEAFAAIPDEKLQAPALPMVLALLDDRLESNQVAAVLALGQFKSQAARAKARVAIEKFQSRLRAKLSTKQSQYDQRITFAACVLEQLSGRRPVAKLCASDD